MASETDSMPIKEAKRMSEERNGNRTHEPNLRELTSQLDGLRDLVDTKFLYVERIMDERHQLYKERAESQKTAVDDALAAVKEQTSASFAASEKAIVKAEDSQKTYNQGHNDLSRKMEQQYSTMVPQPEAKLKWDAIDKALEEMRRDNSVLRSNELGDINTLRSEMMKEIQSLRESRSEGSGKEAAQHTDREQKNWGVGTAIAIVGVVVSILLGVAALIIAVLKH